MNKYICFPENDINYNLMHFAINQISIGNTYAYIFEGNKILRRNCHEGLVKFGWKFIYA